MIDPAFFRDLGYLDKFFDKLESHAATMGGGGNRLKALVAEERVRWSEIKSILGGAPSSASPSVVRTPTTPPGPSTGAMTSPRAKPQFTVGSLVGADKR